MRPRLALALAGPLLLPAAAWALILTVQDLGLPDRALRLEALELQAPAPSSSAASGVEQRGFTWYFDAQVPELRLRQRFEAAALFPGEGPLALYVPSVERDLEVFVDGARVSDRCLGGSGAARRRHRPLLLTLPEELLAPARHTLELRVVGAEREGGFLQPVYLGPRARLAPAYGWLHGFKVTALQTIQLALALLAAFVLALWAQRPRETVYAWFAAGLLCWGVFNAHYLLSGWPVFTSGWQAVTHAALAGMLHCMALFVHRLVGLRYRRTERVLWALAVSSVAALVTGAVLLEPERYWSWVNEGYRYVLLGLGAYVLGRLLALCRQRPAPTLFWLASATFLTVSLGVHDSLRQLGWLDPAGANLMQYGALVVMLVFGQVLVNRFASALRESEELNVHLDRRVEQQTLALADQFERAAGLERAMVLAQERERLVRDMHDGMGGQLVALLTLARAGRAEPRMLEEGLAECLLDLRLVIDSLDTAGEDLAVALGMLRSRLEPRLRAAGLQLHWDTHTLPSGLRLGCEGVLQVLRIVQEALQNAIKHAGASALWVEARVSEAAATVQLVVRDDGCGLPAPMLPGRGLRHMQGRAQRIGARLTLEGAEPGTCVRLSLPAGA